MPQFIRSILLLLTLPFSFSVYASADMISAKTTSNILNTTGDGSTYRPHYDQITQATGITYDTSSGYFRVSKSGVYLATWSLTLSNINPVNTGGAGWIHEAGYGGRGYEPFIYNGNPYFNSNSTGKITINGSQIFMIDVSYDPTVWIGLKIGGNTIKNITLLNNSTFSLKKIA